MMRLLEIVEFLKDNSRYLWEVKELFDGNIRDLEEHEEVSFSRLANTDLEVYGEFLVSAQEKENVCSECGRVVNNKQALEHFGNCIHCEEQAL